MIYDTKDYSVDAVLKWVLHMDWDSMYVLKTIRWFLSFMLHWNLAQGQKGDRGEPGKDGQCLPPEGSVCDKGQKGHRGRRGKRGKQGPEGLMGEIGLPGVQVPYDYDIWPKPISYIRYSLLTIWVNQSLSRLINFNQSWSTQIKNVSCIRVYLSIDKHFRHPRQIKGFWLTLIKFD